MVTYRSIISNPCIKHVSYTCNSSELIQVGTEQVRNKRIILYLPDCIFILLLGAIFINYLVEYYIRHPFQVTFAAIYIKIDSFYKFAMSNKAVRTKRDFKSEYLFRMCSVATNLVTSLEIERIHCATTLCHFGRTRNS